MRYRFLFSVAVALPLFSSAAGAQVHVNVVHAFAGSGPMYPYAPFVQAVDDNFYGTSFAGGADHNGTLFRMTSDGAIAILALLPSPIGGVIQATDGNFYGMTFAGGDSSCGSVYRMTPAGDVTTLYSFSIGGYLSGWDAWCPEASTALVQAADGNLWGVTP